MQGLSVIASFPGIEGVIGLRLGEASISMLEQLGLIGCIGRNHVGQLGVGRTADRNVPDLSKSLPAAPFANGVLITAP